MIKKFNNFILEGVYKDEFLRLYQLAPENLKREIDNTKESKQNKYWHPEGDTFIHTRLVTNRLANCYNDINLNLSGLFHDLGKFETTYFDEKKEDWTSPGHEEISIKILYKYKDWVKEMNGDINIIDFIISNHMRYKYLDEMRLSEQIKLIEHPYFELLKKFSTADYGGTNLECKQIPTHKDIIDKIEKYKTLEKENKIISNKFNGKIIMDKYPRLKGIILGKTINNFKNSFDDFRYYALNNTSKKIMEDFDKFIKIKD